MGLFDKLFGGGKRKKRSKETVQTRGVHMPDLKIPVDEKFTIQFKKNGGKFIYCDSQEEVLEGLRNIIEENHWDANAFLQPESLSTTAIRKGKPEFYTQGLGK